MLALLVIDMQRGLFEAPDSRHDEDGVVRRINCLAEVVRAAKGAVIYIQHEGPKGEPFEPGSAGWEFLPALGRANDDLIVRKRACDAFYETDLASVLESRGVEELLISGCATDFCVDTTLRAAASLNYLVCAVADGHTTADRPHLSAEAVIRHHNWVWAGLILPRSQVKVRTTAQLLEQLSAH